MTILTRPSSNQYCLSSIFLIAGFCFALGVTSPTALAEDDDAPKTPKQQAVEGVKEKLKEGAQEKAMDWLNENFPNWVPAPEVSVGMNDIFQSLARTFDAERESRKYRMCKGAAFVQADSVASEMRNAFVLGGAARTWIEIEKSLIGRLGGPADDIWNTLDPSAESLGELFKDKSNEAKDWVKKKLEEWWSGEPPEVWQTNYSFGGCTSSVNAVWDKANGKFEIMISGDCDCKEMPMEWTPFEKSRTIRLDNWFVRAVGTAKPVITSGGDITLAVSRTDIAVSANCECDNETQPPPPPFEPDPVEMIQMGQMRTLSGVRCTACQPLADTINIYVAEHNRMATRMNELAALIINEPYKTPERDGNLQTWNDFFKKITRIQKLHDETFNQFVECERTECALGDGMLQFDQLSTIPEQWTDCEQCIPLMQTANTLISEYNIKVGELNAIARTGSGLRLGTTEGNSAHRNWQRLKAGLDTLNPQIQQKIAELSACKAQHCAGGKWDPRPKLQPITTNCPPCQDLVARYNKIIEEINQIADKLNEIQAKEKAYVLEHGDAWGAGMDGLSDLLEKEGFHALVVRNGQLLDQLPGMRLELTRCEKQCATVEVIDTKFLLGNDPYDPRDPIAEDSQQQNNEGGSGPGFVQVVNNIPINRLSLSGSDACPENHYHGNANNCNGVFTVDPAPGVCGQGPVSAVISIPVSACPDF